MNNEINRRDFMRLSAASIMTASVTLNLGNTAFATAASEDPKDVLKNFFESFSPADHESWVNYFASSVYGYYREFAQNAFNQAKRLGLLDIDKAELLYAEKVNNVYAPKYYEFNRYYDSGTNYACYKTITDMETETGEYFGNGTNFSLVLMIQESSGWKIGGICKCPRNLGSVPAGVTVSRQSYGFVSYQTKPAITNAINAVDGKKLVSSDGQLFFTSYFAGSSNADGKNSGRLRQNGSNYLASTKSYTYTEILHYYYDKSSYNNPSVGIVKIN